MNSNYYLVYFEGNAFSAFSDWFGGRKTINKSCPYKNKGDAISASKEFTRACIVYHARNQICIHSHEGYIKQAVPDLMNWAREHIETPEHISENDGMIETENESQKWSLSKIKQISHKVEYTEFKIAVDTLTKLVTATVAGIVGNIPGIIDAVSGLTIDICYGEDLKKEDDAWIKDITDGDGNKGILVMKAMSETSVKKNILWKNKKTLSMNGLVCILVPLTPSAKLKCDNIRNKHASNILTQIEKEFNFSA